jgi:hypothetical protein
MSATLAAPAPAESSSSRQAPYRSTGMQAPESDPEGHQRATINGGIRGAAIAAVLAGGAHLALRKKPYYMNLSSGPKAFCYVALVTPCISISAEKAGEAFERSRWFGLGKMELDRQASRKELAWNRLSTSEKMAAWGKDNKWTLIGGACVSSRAWVQ